ncbi:hypothetical protein LTS18_007837 [Coniosporium uncinatum]|uniref:Uncharacterized protein n=1 Tax=Coniosporium uncinatum TaxID=93489 RepID=A0ACC3DZI0_9PEZI|nr:hypothetical protein LTS18_007837 [Coniosporium uncinatum]
MDSQQPDYWTTFPRTSGVYESSSDMSPMQSIDSSPIISDFEAVPLFYQPNLFQQFADDLQFGYQLPLTPSEFESADESSYCSPPPLTSELSYPPPATSQEKQHTTSGRRRAQNRAAQRAFRERKEKHARDLEVQLAALSEKHRKLETSHEELNAAYDKLRKTVELLTEKESEESASRPTPQRNVNTLRKVLDILHGEVKSKDDESV